MNRYSIGQNYEKTFKAVCSIIENGEQSFIQNLGLSYDRERNIIRYNENEFVYEMNSHNEVNYQTLNLNETDDGASWFNFLRNPDNASTNDSQVKWKNLLELIARNYHKKYSFTEYVQDDNSLNISDELKANYEQKTNEIISKFFDNIASPEIKIIEKLDEIKPIDIYGVSLKLSISSGGESKTLLGKIYFTKLDENNLQLMSSEYGKSIESNLEINNQENDNNIDYEDVNKDEIDTEIRKVLIATESQFINMSETNDLMKIMTINEEGQDVLNDLVRDDNFDVLNISCDKITVLGIFHVSWRNCTIKVSSKGYDLLEFSFDLNNTVTIKCKNCNECLVSNNIIMGTSLDINKVASKEDVRGTCLDNKHFIKTECNSACSEVCFKKFKCYCDVEQVEYCNLRTREDLSTLRCKNCHIPESVYVSLKREHNIPNGLYFDRNENSLEVYKIQDIGKCACCGTLFNKNKEDGNHTYCKLCSSIFNKNLDDQDENKICKSNYKMIRQILPLHTRFLNLFKKKYAIMIPNDTRILLCLGKQKYLYDLLDLNTNGHYLPKPKKLKIR